MTDETRIYDKAGAKLAGHEVVTTASRNMFAAMRIPKRSTGISRSSSAA
jgi:hypothetical protein